LSIRTDLPEVSEVPHGVIRTLPSPAYRKQRRIVCVYDRNDQPVEASVRIRGFDAQLSAEPDRMALREARRDNRSAYFLGTTTRHYGHFLVDTLCRAWAWRERGEDCVAVILLPPITNYARALCALIPGLAERLEVMRATTRFDHVTVASPAFSTAGVAHVEFKSMCERMAERAVPSPEPMTEQPLYISRAGLQVAASRLIVGEMRLERFFEREGFRVVRPETLPIPEQIALFNKHKWIVSPLGSACHTRLFSRQPVNLVMLTGKMHNGSEQPFKTNYALCDLLSEGAAHYAQVLSSPDLGTDLGYPLVIEEEKFLVFLKGLGLVQSSAAFDEPPPDLDTYRTKWVEFAAKKRIKQEKKRALLRAIGESDGASHT
jgi:Glycosyltransferase 61